MVDRLNPVESGERHVDGYMDKPANKDAQPAKRRKANKGDGSGVSSCFVNLDSYLITICQHEANLYLLENSEETEANWRLCFTYPLRFF